VFPEEVEEVLKTHAAVHDAVAVGIPDDRFGQVVVGVVSPRGGANVDESSVIAHVKSLLAHYKAPKKVVVVPDLEAGPKRKGRLPSLGALRRQTIRVKWSTAGEFLFLSAVPRGVVKVGL
jgi:3-oxocholest-4-en-26-oate---CoA ligase